MKEVEIYTDGACRGNPGRGGWAAILVYGNHKMELVGGEKETTNNRMELSAAIYGMESLKEACTVTLYSDSRYLVDAINQGWLASWKAHGWRRGKEELKNDDLWKRLDAQLSRHRVTFEWVKGHDGHLYNERCDELACGAADLYLTESGEEAEAHMKEFYGDKSHSPAPAEARAACAAREAASASSPATAGASAAPAAATEDPAPIRESTPAILDPARNEWDYLTEQLRLTEAEIAKTEAEIAFMTERLGRFRALQQDLAARRESFLRENSDFLEKPTPVCSETTGETPVFAAESFFSEGDA